jgi:glycosyltransferase involved in cell wall biosynthesis
VENMGNHATQRVHHVAVRAGPWRRDRPVRVLLLAYSLANGGLERQLSVLARHLPPQWERRVWSLEGGTHAGAVMAAGVPLTVCPRRARFDVTPAVELWRLIRSWRPDVVHAWDWMPAAAAVPACVALGIPLIDGSIRMGSVPRSFGRPRRGIMHFAALVVANSSAGLAAWRMDNEKGRVIYNAFEGDRLLAVSSRRPAARDGDPVTVVMAARMAPPKDYATVIRAARLLVGSGSARWRFLLVGDGPDRPALLAEAADLVAAGVVAFPAGGTEVVGQIRGSHVGLLVSDPAVLAEGCSNSIMEYMACGLPVVCTDSGGCRELVRHGESGLVIPPRDPAALAGGLTYLREHPSACATMGAAGQARIEQEFTVRRMVDEYVRAYEEAVARRRGRE